jgi:hypothetical protein
MIEFPRRWRIYEYTDHRGIGVIKAWEREVEKDVLARLHQKLDTLELNGSELTTGLLAGTKQKHIDKLRVFGKKTTWRVMVCKGTIDVHREFTILFIAQEKDRKLIPKDADKRAEANRKELLSDPSRRRIYERNSGTT